MTGVHKNQIPASSDNILKRGSVLMCNTLHLCTLHYKYSLITLKVKLIQKKSRLAIF